MKAFFMSMAQHNKGDDSGCRSTQSTKRRQMFSALDDRNARLENSRAWTCFR